MLLAPSILSLDYTRFNEQINILNEKVKWLHFDVMDGHFVPNLSFGPDILKAFKRSSELFMDVHLMVEDPIYFSDIFAKAGANSITFHYEVFNDISKCKELIKKIKGLGLKVGISIKPKTDVSVLDDLLKDCDLILLMSVEPGFGGQAFMESVYSKIVYLNDKRLENNYHYLLEVDGGVSSTNALKLVNSGIDILVAGSSVFNGNIAENIANIEKICQKAE